MLRRTLLSVMGIASASLCQRPQRRIIDVHLHAYKNDARWGRTSRDAITGQTVRASSGPDAQMSETFAAMKQLNIVRAVVSGDHEAVLRWHASAPEQIIIGYQIVDPSEIDERLLRREHAAGRLQVLAE